MASLAKMALATQYAETGDIQQAQGILEGLMKDPQGQIPKQAVGIQLAHVLTAQGKRDDAIKVLHDAKDLDPESALNGQLSVELNRLEGGPAVNQ